jgi:hypothetical protein
MRYRFPSTLKKALTRPQQASGFRKAALAVWKITTASVVVGCHELHGVRER